MGTRKHGRFAPGSLAYRLFASAFRKLFLDPSWLLSLHFPNCDGHPPQINAQQRPMANWHATQPRVGASGINPAFGCSGLDSDSQVARQPFLPHQILSAFQTPMKWNVQNRPTDRTASLRRLLLLLLLLLMRPAACGPPCGSLLPSAEPHFPFSVAFGAIVFFLKTAN